MEPEQHKHSDKRTKNSENQVPNKVSESAQRLLAFFRDPARPAWQRIGAGVLIALLVVYPFSGERKPSPARLSDSSFPSGDSGLVDATAGYDALRAQTREMTERVKQDLAEKAASPDAVEAESNVQSTAGADSVPAEDDETGPDLETADAEPRVEQNLDSEPNDDRSTTDVAQVATPFRSLRSIAPNAVAVAPTAEGLFVANTNSVVLLKDHDPEQVTVRLEPKTYETLFNDDLGRISSLLFNSAGELWVGFMHGQLMRHDKYGWKILVRPSEQLRGPASSLVEYKNAVRVGSRGLWKWSEAVQRLVPIKSFAQRPMLSMLIGNDGTLYAGGEGGIWAFNAETRSWRSFWKASREDAAVFTMASAPDGTLYVGTKNGLVLISANAVVLERMVPGERITAIAVDRENHLWVGTRNNGLHYFNGQTWHHVDAGRGISNRINALYFDSKDQLWLASEHAGLLLADRSAILPWIAQFAAVAPDLNKPMIFPDACDAALGLLKEISLSGSIAVETIDGKPLVFFDGVQRCPKGIGFRRPDGAVLVKNDWTLTVFRNGERTTVEIPKEYAADTTTAALLDSRDQIWLGTSLQGVFQYSGDKWFAYGAGDGFENNPVTALYEDNTGTVWVASMPNYDKPRSTYVGSNLHALAPSGWIHLSPKEGLGAWGSLSLILLKNTNLLLATNGGISIINNKGEVSNFGARDGFKPAYSYSATLDGSGRVWLAHQYFGDGITWFDGTHFFRLKPETKLFSNRISWIAHDRLGRVWLAASNGAVGVYPLSFFHDNQVGIELRKQRQVSLVQ